MSEKLFLSDTITVDSCWIRIDHGELLSFADGPSCPEHGRVAAGNDVHIGITAVIHQTASQAQALSKYFNWIFDTGVVSLEGINGSVVEAKHKVEL